MATKIEEIIKKINEDEVLRDSGLIVTETTTNGKRVILITKYVTPVTTSPNEARKNLVKIN